MTLFQKAKETLEMCYVNTGEYSPDAEEPSKSRYKITNGQLWKWFCGNVDKLTQEPRSREEEEEEKARKKARTEGADASSTDHASDRKLVLLLNELKILV